MIQAYDAVFFSPHQDDAVLSCGALIASLTAKNIKVCVCTVFNRYCGNVDTPVVRHYLSRSGQTSALMFEKIRQQEDVLALKKLSVTRVCFNLTDAAFRGYYSDFNQLYGGRIALNDIVQAELSEKLDAFSRKWVSENTRIYIPLGVGGHVDHVLVSQTCLSFFRQSLTLWEDVPYNRTYAGVIKRLAIVGKTQKVSQRKIFNGGKYRKEKQTAIEAYASQLVGLRLSGLSNFNYGVEYFYQSNPK